jgi:predicted transposase YbfD/YdcC
LSAWYHTNGLVLGERQTDSKSDEITAIPLLLELLELKSNTITIVAAGCQKAITKLITKKQVNYVLGLNPKLYQTVEEHNCLYDAFNMQHGRTVRRRYCVVLCK